MKQYLRNLFAAVLLLSAYGTQAQYVITTYAGTANNGGYYGDDGPAISALLSSPSDVALDNTGNLYIADFINNVIRKVDTMGMITTIAGTALGAGGMATGGYSGDNGPATAADLNGPFALALDKFGNIIFADGYNHVVRKISTSGIITTIAGRHSAPGYSGNGGPATAASLNNPVGIALDTAGNIYIADDHNNAIRKVTPAGIISTFAGDSTAGYAGNGGPATVALLNTPIGVAVDHRGNVYIADAMNNTVRKVDTSGIITAYVGGADTAHGYSGDNGPAVNARLDYPVRLVFDDSDNLYVSDANNNVVRKVTPEGTIYPYAGSGTGGFSGDNGRPDTAQMLVTYGMAIKHNGVAYIADRGNQIIRRIGPPLPNGVNHIRGMLQTGLNVYPNPVVNNGTLTVNISSNITEDAVLNITNVLGQKINQQTIKTNKLTTIKMDMPAGIYFIKASNAHGSWGTQVVVE